MDHHGVFHDADIQVDAILSYPWLEEKYLGVYPHMESLALWGEPLRLLQSYRHKPTETTETPEEPWTRILPPQ